MKNLACNRILQEEQPCGVRISAWSQDLNIFAASTLFCISISSPSLFLQLCVCRQHDFVGFNG